MKKRKEALGAMLPSSMFDRYQLGRGNDHQFDETGHCLPSYQQTVLRPFAEIVARKFGSRARILDAASGKGEAANLLEEWFDFTTVRLDISADLEGLSDGNRVRSNVGLLPFREGSFDAIHFKDAMVHISNRRDLLRQLKKILAPGGIVAIVTACMGAPGYFHYYERVGSRPVNFSHPADLRRKFKATEITYPDAVIGPPYHPTNSLTLTKLARSVGFKDTIQTLWTNPRNEPDWYKIPTQRSVLFLEKPVA